MGDDAKAGRRYDVGCPFCGLICDDLTVESADGGLRIVAGACRLSRRGFETPIAPMPPMVDGRPVEQAVALERAAAILAQARAPVFAVAADVAGARAALRLADRLGGVIDHPDSDGLFLNLRILQDSGSLTTTLSEVRNRADVVLMVGADPRLALPRFFERCLDPRQTLFQDKPIERRLFRLGPSTTEQDPIPPHPDVTELSCAVEHLPQAIAAINALLRGGHVAAAGVPGLDPDRLGQIVDRLKTARYAVVAWTPASLVHAGGELIGRGLLDLVRHLTLSTRASLLALGGGGNVLGVNQVCLWQTGYPLRTAFGRGVPEHDPYRFAARRMVAQGEADALVWISAFAEAAPPTGTEVPTIVLAPAVVEAARGVAACIPVGTPGLDHGGQMFRTDNVVSLRVSAQRRTALPQVGAVLGAIETRLQGEVR